MQNDKRENSITPTPEDTGIVSSKVNDSDVENLNEIMKICSAENSMVEMVIYSPEDPKNRLTNLIDFEGSHQGNGEVNSDEDMPELSLLGKYFIVLIYCDVFYFKCALLTKKLIKCFLFFYFQ